MVASPPPHENAAALLRRQQSTTARLRADLLSILDDLAGDEPGAERGSPPNDGRTDPDRRDR